MLHFGQKIFTHGTWPLTRDLNSLDTVTIYDVTNKIGNTTTLISRTSYTGAKYIHQGAVLDISNQEYLVLDDELDERDGTEGPATSKLPITYIFDIRDLESPKLTGYYEGKTRSIDHNQYIVDGYNYQCTYTPLLHSRTESRILIIHTQPTMAQASACSTSARSHPTRPALGCARLDSLTSTRRTTVLREAESSPLQAPGPRTRTSSQGSSTSIP